jgi:photosystem II S4 domain protein
MTGIGFSSGLVCVLNDSNHLWHFRNGRDRSHRICHHASRVCHPKKIQDFRKIYSTLSTAHQRIAHQSFMLPKDELLAHVEDPDSATRVIDQAEQAVRTWEVVMTDFLSPPQWIDVEHMFQRLTEVNVVAWGGYPQAERQRAAIARPDLPIEPQSVELAAIDIAGNFLFDPASHRDFLGSILGTGIVRGKVGDIIVLGERGAQAIITPDLVDFLEMSLTQVRSVPVKTRRIDLSELKVREPRKKELTTVEASMRLDAIASAGFGMSRSKMVDLINTGDVRVNWRSIKQASHQIKSGDLVAIRGKGRLQIGDVAVTKKERYRIQLTRFV